MKREHFDKDNIDDAATIFVGGRSWIAFDCLRGTVVPTLREIAKDTGSAGLVISTLDFILAELDAGTKEEE